MSFPDFIMGFPSLDLPFSEDVVQSRAIRSDDGLCVFFTFLQDMELPPHSHGAQWGTVVEGEIEFTIGGETRIYGPGDSYSIPTDVVHGAMIKAGTRVIDVFSEPDRYPIKRP
ncbi:Cupin domain-containing protein [Roseovarius marisflavi]|uniref:Cupin domain-containing protein n=1 Tax=Roseovarius marisflavi TaxID=1054996 RepID=A0A1M6WFW9_9RHOB|nr:cupin domain-containing protein [Roseovarius marisflavi]SHK92506.1 Cupin domain-containing protein [Roseovarius marisflavi]